MAERLKIQQNRRLITVDIWIFQSMRKYTWLGNMLASWGGSAPRADDGIFRCIIRDISWQDAHQASDEPTIAAQPNSTQLFTIWSSKWLVCIIINS